MKKTNTDNRQKNNKNAPNQWIKDWAYVIIAVVLIRAFIVSAYRIPSGSMEDSLLIGDHLFACKFLYGIRIPFTDTRIFKFHDPKYKEIVIFRYPYERKDFVKRCIATAGDIVEIKDKKVYVNNELLEEHYTKFDDPTVYEKLQLEPYQYQKIWEKSGFMNGGGNVRDNFGPVKVPEDCIFVMGDNRDASFDSRFWGPLNKRYLLGKSLILYFSWDKNPPLYKIWKKIRWNRIGIIVWG
ncbi:MAG: signal peptidase I [bacterium]|nr:signal peptidase I [bacterium]